MSRQPSGPGAAGPPAPQRPAPVAETIATAVIVSVIGGLVATVLARREARR